MSAPGRAVNLADRRDGRADEDAAEEEAEEEDEEDETNERRASRNALVLMTERALVMARVSPTDLVIEMSGVEDMMSDDVMLNLNPWWC